MNQVIGYCYFYFIVNQLLRLQCSGDDSCQEMAGKAAHNETMQRAGAPRGAAHCRTVAENRQGTPLEVLTFMTGPVTSGILYTSKLIIQTSKNLPVYLGFPRAVLPSWNLTPFLVRMVWKGGALSSLLVIFALENAIRKVQQSLEKLELNVRHCVGTVYRPILMTLNSWRSLFDCVGGGRPKEILVNVINIRHDQSAIGGGREVNIVLSRRFMFNTLRTVISNTTQFYPCLMWMWNFVSYSTSSKPSRVLEGSAGNASKFRPKAKEEGLTKDWLNHVVVVSTLIICRLYSVPMKPTLLIVKLIKY